MLFYLLFADSCIGLFVANEEGIALTTTFFPAINRGMACQEVEGQLIRLVICAAAATFQDDVAQVLVHLDAALELPNLQGDTITGGIAKCAEENLWVLDISLQQQDFHQFCQFLLKDAWNASH